jgi:hypothetical protein
LTIGRSEWRQQDFHTNFGPCLIPAKKKRDDPTPITPVVVMWPHCIMVPICAFPEWRIDDRRLIFDLHQYAYAGPAIDWSILKFNRFELEV